MMETLEKLRNSTNASLLNTPADTLVLRAFGGEFQGEVLRVPGAKCTIGSSPHCTLRVLTPGVRPIHCSILRGPRGTIVRSWDDETQLNDRDFTDAMLRPADRLRCGPVEFEIVAGARPSLGFHTQDFRRVSVTLPVLPNSTTSTESPTCESSRGVEHLQTSRELLRRRLRRVLSQWRSSRSEFARLQADARLDENLGHDLHQRIADLETQLTDYRNQLSDRDHNLARANAECLSLLDQVENLTLCNRDLTLTLENRSKQWCEERNDLKAQLEAAIQEVENAKDVRQQVRSAEDLAAQTQAQCAFLAEQLQQLNQQHCESLRQLEEAHQSKLGLQTSLDSAELRLVELGNQAPHSGNWEAANAAQTEELAMWRTKVETAEASAAHSLEAMNALQSQIDKLQTQCEAATEHAKQLDELRQQLEARLTEATSNTTQQTEQTHASDAARQLDELTTTLAELRNQNDGLRDQIMDLTRSNDLATEQLRDAESSRQQLESLVNDLSAQLVENVPQASIDNVNNFSTTNETLSLELSQWKQRAAELQTRLDQIDQHNSPNHSSEILDSSYPSTRPSNDESTSEPTNEFLSHAENREGPQHGSDVKSQFEEKKSRLDEDELFQSPLLASLLRSSSSTAPAFEPADREPVEGEPEDSFATHEPCNELQKCLPYTAAFRDVDLVSPDAELIDEAAGEPAYALSKSNSAITSESEEVEAQEVPNERPAPSPTGLMTASYLKQTEEADEINNHPVAPKHVQQATLNSNHLSASSSEEESIEDYMSRLLSRMRSDSPSKGNADKPAEVATKANSSASAASSVEPQKEQVVAVSKKPQYVPRTVPAEFKANLSAMREIANTTARSAIETHQKRSSKESSQAKLFGALIAVSASFGTLYYAIQNSGGKNALWQFAMALFAFGVACHWTIQSVRLSSRLAAASKEEADSVAKHQESLAAESKDVSDSHQN